MQLLLSKKHTNLDELESNPDFLIEPIKAFSCQRRVITRIFDGDVHVSFIYISHRIFPKKTFSYE